MLLAVAILLALFAQMENNHVIIFLNKYRIDLSLFALVLIFILGYIVVTIIWWLWSSGFNLPHALKVWYFNYKTAKSIKYLMLAQINYFAGNYSECLKQVTDILGFERNQEKRFLSLILAYKACSHLNDDEKQHKIMVELEQYTEKKWQKAKLKIFAKDENNFKS